MKILIILLIVFIVWVFLPYSTTSLKSTSTIYKDSKSKVYETDQIDKTPIPYKDAKSEPVKINLKTYRCDKRKYCSQMRSYEEAKYFLDHCRGVKMDGDGDGIPCERQFGRH